MSGGRIPREFIDELLVRVDIVDLIDSYVPLKKSGANYVARCPFHSEKTPSFSVNRNKQFFHCFGCGASGNAISFLMDLNHLDFIEAVEDLATFAGLEVPRASKTHTSLQNKADLGNLYTLLEQVSAFYVEQLRTSSAGKKAVAYLKNRGISGDIANTFMLGYAPAQWQTLTNQFDAKLLLESGMTSRKEGGQIYDRFRERIMFPIRDKRGRIIGFGGRVLDDSLPKYLNSPETPLFHKSQEVYGLYELLKKDPKPAKILFVEGYLDVIALAQNSIGFATAALGTAVSQAHLELLFRYTSEIVLCFDGDNAGREAAWKAITAAFPTLRDGRHIRIMLLPPHHDPDSLVREEGPAKFMERVQTAQALSDYFFEHFSKDLKLSEMEGRSNLKSEAEAYLKQLPIGAFRELMFAELARLSKLHIQDNDAIAALKSQTTKLRQKNIRPTLPGFIIASLLQNPRLITLVEQENIEWQQLQFDGSKKFIDILQTVMNLKPANTSVLLEFYRGHNDEEIIKKFISLDLSATDNNLEQEFTDALKALIKQARKARLEALLAKESRSGLNQQEKEELRIIYKYI